MIRAFLLAIGVWAYAISAQAQDQNASSAPMVELRWLDRITGLQGDVTLPIDVQSTLGNLTVTLQDCRYPTGAIASDAYALLTIQDDETMWFSGWMVASSPALNALEHPRYDIWVLRCKTS